jgi:hypothetical protein
MSKRKSKAPKSEKYCVDLQEKIKSIRDHLTPFQDETSSVRQSWFHDFVEWQAKVLFPNLRDTSERLEVVRLEFWKLDDGAVLDEKKCRSLAERALSLLEQLEECHRLLDQRRRKFELIRSICHDLSDSVEIINSELESVARDLQTELAQQQ